MTTGLSRLRTFTSNNKITRTKEPTMISSPMSTTSVTMTTTPKRLSEIDDGILRSMTQNDLAIHFGSLVKRGQIDQASAMVRFSELSQSLPAFKKPDMAPDDLTDVSYQVKLKNISHKYTLKFDLKSKGINLYVRGKCKIKIRYDEDVKSYEADEDNNFILRTASLDLMEFEAEGLEEKNAILEVLERFEQQRRSAEDEKNQSQLEENNRSEVETELDTVGSLQRSERHNREGPKINLEQSLRVPVFKQVLKEGELEKQGHGKGAFSWPMRYVEIKPGQLSYYKVPKTRQPLNILTLDHTVQIETYSDGFEIKLRPKRDQNSTDRSYNFRVHKGPNDVESELREWIHALELAVKGTNEKEIMMSLCTVQPRVSPTKTISDIKRHKSPTEFDKQKRRISRVFTRPKIKERGIREPIPSVELEEPNIAIFLTQLKRQINFLLLLSEEFPNEKVKKVSENMLHICKFMEDQIRGNPDDDLPFQPINRIGSVSSMSAPGTPISPKKSESQLTMAHSPPSSVPADPDDVGPGDIEGDLEESSVDLTEKTTIAQLKLDLSSLTNRPAGDVETDNNQVEKVGPRSPVKSHPGSPIKSPHSPIKSPHSPIKSPTKSLEVFSLSPTQTLVPKSEGVPIDTSLLKNIPGPPPNMQEAIDYHLSIENCPTGNPKIPKCPPNMPEAIKIIKTVVLGIPDIPYPPPNLPEVAKKLGVDSLIGGRGLEASVKKVDMKPLIWNKIGAQHVKINSIWAKAMEGIDLDLDELEHCFKDEKKGQKIKQIKTIEKPKKELLLDDKRAMGIDIFLKKSRFNIEDLDEFLNNAVESTTENGEKVEDGKFYLQLEELEDLSRYPTEQDNDLFKAVKVKPEDMEKADRFIHTVCHIQYYKERVEVLLLIREIPENYTLLLEPIGVLQKACEELKNDEKLEKILALVLMVGNHINSGSMRGNAGGFHLSLLSKLVSYKGVDSKFSLLHFIIQHIMDKQGELLDFHKSLLTVNKATDASVEGVLAEIDLMKKQLNKIKKIREMIAESPDAKKYSELIKSVSSFLEIYDAKYKELIATHNELRNVYAEVLAKFGETEDAESDEFMGYINDFVRDFKRVSTEMIKKREMEKVKEEKARKNTINNAGSSNTVAKGKSEKGGKPTGTKSTLAQTQSPSPTTSSNEKNLKNNPSTKKEGAGSNLQEGACKMDWTKTRAPIKKEYDSLQIEKKSRFKTEWKAKKFILSDKQLRCLSSKNEDEDKVYLGKETQIFRDKQDDTVIEIKCKVNDKDKRMRIKCPSQKHAEDLLNDFKQAQS